MHAYILAVCRTVKYAGRCIWLYILYKGKRSRSPSIMFALEQMYVFSVKFTLEIPLSHFCFINLPQFYLSPRCDVAKRVTVIVLIGVKFPGIQYTWASLIWQSTIRHTTIHDTQRIHYQVVNTITGGLYDTCSKSA